MDKDFSFHQRKKQGKTYVSPQIVREAVKDDEGNVLIPEYSIRIASKVFEKSGTDSFAKIKDELVVRRTTGGKQEIKAVFYEDDRGLEKLTFQRYGLDTGNPYKSAHFSFSPNEVEKIIEFLSSLKLLKFKGPLGENATDEQIQELLLDKEKVLRVLHSDIKAVVEFAKNEVTSEDIVALSYRKKQLRTFQNLLIPEYMAETIIRRKAKGEEKVWQDFFEKNPWIFGYGLNYVFSSNLDNRKLELAVKGSDISGKGKIADGVLKTLGAVNSFCYVEIKKASSKLLHSEYRSGCWRVDPEVSGGVSQVQTTIELAVQNLGKRFRPEDKQGFPTGEVIFNYKPKGFLVIGCLSEFVGEGGINEAQYRSFELYRRNLNLPEIITFDELLQRAQSIVESYDK